MSSATEQTRPTIPEMEWVVLHDIRYGDYLALRGISANSHLRMTYYNGTLEIMSPEASHERPSRRIGVFILVLCEEMDIDFEGLRSTTFHRGERKKKRGHGKEPDECFYFANAAKVEGKETLDLDVDPPSPDLWIEVDHRSSSRGKLPVYAALGVPEVWRFWPGSVRLWFGRRSDDGTNYEATDRSVALPMLTPALVLEALALGRGVSEKTWLKALRAWVRRNFPVRP